jgi:hypothetical protein
MIQQGTNGLGLSSLLSTQQQQQQQQSANKNKE